MSVFRIRIVGHVVHGQAIPALHRGGDELLGAQRRSQPGDRRLDDVRVVTAEGPPAARRATRPRPVYARSNLSRVSEFGDRLRVPRRRRRRRWHGRPTSARRRRDPVSAGEVRRRRRARAGAPSRIRSGITDATPIFSSGRAVTGPTQNGVTVVVRTLITASVRCKSLARIRNDLHLTEAVIRVLTTTVTPFCVGPVTARPLEKIGVASVMPERMDSGRWRVRSPTNFPAGNRISRSPGTPWACMPPGRRRRRGARSVAQLVDSAEIARTSPGAVVSARHPAGALGGDDPHVVEAAGARLRSAIGAKELIATAVKRGYRLAVDFMPDDTGRNTDMTTLFVAHGTRNPMASG